MGLSSTDRLRAGFTLIELVIGLTLLVITAAKVTMVMRAASRFTGAEATGIVLQDKAQQILDRIAYEVQGANRETLIPDAESPFHNSELEYRVSLGIEDGVVVWDDPRAIGLDGTRVVWRENPGEENARRVVWSNTVRQLLEGEVVNGIDDNGNGLIDETGLSFVMEEDRVTIMLSLSRTDEHGVEFVYTLNTTVTCRNFLWQGAGA